ncbi:biliverdin-producing heme oxygenase [uncultured Caulobacter sp.]|uniref:biliverdin-producing heme oxygenase n=1 Tax=uncultured Caulobacter sp. TaxID=158749 RepID=UPI00261FD32B|nr:biliverdin-producing heme oxygenase [uncultured Caulobacter sp.]
MSDISLRDRLRGATAERHAALDDLIAARGVATPDRYGAFLAASAAALTPLEIALERAGVQNWLPDWPERTRRAALARDLIALGLEAPSSPGAFVPSRSFGVGLLYTLEGSRLGGRVLARRVRDAGPDLPVAYLTHGQAGEAWRVFLAWLEAQSVGIRTDAAEAGARYGFRYFSDAFESRAPVGARSGALNVRGGARGRV